MFPTLMIGKHIGILIRKNYVILNKFKNPVIEN